MDIEATKILISDLEESINLKKGAVLQLRQEMCEFLCPFTVGQRVINADNEPEIVASISAGYSIVGYDFKTFKIKAGGVPYKRASYVSSIAKYTAV